jgi:hypothetical protein
MQCLSLGFRALLLAVMVPLAQALHVCMALYLDVAVRLILLKKSGVNIDFV